MDEKIGAKNYLGLEDEYSSFKKSKAVILPVPYDKTTTYKGRVGNHFLMQVFRFQIGVKDQADDLLDCFCYGIAIALGDWQGY